MALSKREIELIAWIVSGTLGCDWVGARNPVAFYCHIPLGTEGEGGGREAWSPVPLALS